MANEKRLIDANALDEELEILKVRFKAQGRNTVAEDYNFVQTVLMTAPTVDAVEVVRCENCRYFGTSQCAMDTYAFDVTEESFCSYGERRTNA